MKFLSALRRRKQQQDVLLEELAAHVAELEEQLTSEGYPPQDARLEARRRFGNQTALLEGSRAVWRFSALDAIARDLRFSWRLLRRQPWVMLSAIASIAIGVGANTAVTSVVDTLILNPLGLKNSERLTSATVHIKQLQMLGSETSGAELRDLELSNSVFSAVAAAEHRAWRVSGDQPSRLIGVAVTPEFFKVFGVTLTLGHVFSGSDENSIVISDKLWQSHFARVPDVIGQKLLLDGKPYQVTGVAPPNFHFPVQAEAWTPLILLPDRYVRGNNMDLSLVARLQDGVTVQQAQQRVDHELLKLRNTQDGQELNKLGYGIDVEPLSRRVAGDLRLPLIFVWLAASVLLLAACANVASLLMVRAGSRRKEIAIRISVGAGKWQLLRQLLTESIILALFGGVGGFALAALLIAALKRQQLPYQNMLALVKLDHRMLAYGLALALLSSLVFGLVPALQLLREQHTAAMVRSRRKWFQNVYIVGQVSAAMLLLVLMGLLLKSLKAIETLRPGFDGNNLTTAFIIKPTQNPDAFFARLLTNLRSSPVVQSAALAYSIPFGGDAPTSMFDIKSHKHKNGEPEWHGEAYQVSPGYFETLRVPLLRGRRIDESDTKQAPVVCVIDEGFAKRFFRNEEPLGQEIAMYGGWARVVGVVGTVRDQTLEATSRPVVYYALAQIPYFPTLGVIVRSPISAASVIRSAVSNADPNLPVYDVKTMEERISSAESTPSLLAILVSIFAIVTISLAAIGLHGVIAQVVAESGSEIGVRMALGARAADIFQHYALSGIGLSIVGVIIGLSAAAASAGFMRSFLYEVRPLDPAVMFLAAMGAIAVSILAVLAPALRAAHVDPQTALRTE